MLVRLRAQMHASKVPKFGQMVRVIGVIGIGPEIGASLLLQRLHRPDGLGWQTRWLFKSRHYLGDAALELRILAIEH